MVSPTGKVLKPRESLITSERVLSSEKWLTSTYLTVFVRNNRADLPLSSTITDLFNFFTFRVVAPNLMSNTFNGA